jgi:hypothetical protein
MEKIIELSETDLDAVAGGDDDRIILVNPIPPSQSYRPEITVDSF